MFLTFWKRHWTAMLPAAAVAVSLGGLWLWASFLYAPASLGEQHALRLGAFVGWLGLLLLATTVAAIVWTATARAPSMFGGEKRRVFLGFALLGDVAGLLLMAVGVGGHFLGWMEWVRIYGLFISWLALWTVVAFVLKRWGPGMSVGISLVAAMLLMAGPVAFTPLARAAGWKDAENSATTTSATRPAALVTQERVAEGIGIACPLLAALDAARPAVQVNWTSLPQMYALSGMHDVPMALPTWWLNTAVYSAAALLVALIGFAFRRGSRLRGS